MTAAAECRPMARRLWADLVDEGLAEALVCRNLVGPGGGGNRLV
jgi:hypothetical protein